MLMQSRWQGTKKQFVAIHATFQYFKLFHKVKKKSGNIKNSTVDPGSGLGCWVIS